MTVSGIKPRGEERKREKGRDRENRGITERTDAILNHRGRDAPNKLLPRVLFFVLAAILLLVCRIHDYISRGNYGTATFLARVLLLCYRAARYSSFTLRRTI